jgi:hypothetical protein
MVLDALKKRLHDAANTKGGKWIKELPNALWGLRTQPSKPTGQSPYFRVYGSETILPANVIWDSPAVEQYDEGISEYSFDWSMAECFRAFTSCSSKASARSTASLYPWSMPDFCRDLSATSCSKQQLSTGYSESTAD